jgi:hypothetical protein
MHHVRDSGGKLAKRKFSNAEDDAVRNFASEQGRDSWASITKVLPLRTPRQCRERWAHYLRPGIDLTPWSESEDAILRIQFQRCGPRWCTIRTFLPGRTDVSIKNRWTLLRRKRGITEPQRPKKPPPAAAKDDAQSAAAAPSILELPFWDIAAFGFLSDEE